MAPPRGHHLFWAETLILTRPPGRWRRACARLLLGGRDGVRASARAQRKATRRKSTQRMRRPPSIAGRPPRDDRWPIGLVLASVCMLGWSLPVLTWLALT